MVRDWSVSSETSLSDHRQIHFALHQTKVREKCDHTTRQMDWTGYIAYTAWLIYQAN